LAADIEAVSQTMLRHVDRELIRARVSSTVISDPMNASELRILVAGIVATLARTPRGEHVEFDVEISADTMLPFDKADLADVLGNLLENAVRHARGKVKLTAARRHTSCTIQVEDNGPGVPPDFRAKILERGERLDESGGAGLGLAIVRDILEAYGWKFELGSSELGGLMVTIAPLIAQVPDAPHSLRCGAA
jgi:signal transduction histidine kinase